MNGVEEALWMTAEAIETRWDGVATVAAILGIAAVIVTALATGTIGSHVVLFGVVALSGLGGYSVAHATISRFGGGHDGA